ncbi:hypothetical protein ACLI1A_18455 [Flavobacterium sp. RHBU_3]|uniref:hypothetical protein n=1 Tax=Flavobacterium sp. RHBU_3 TaxID=3391184 RepID=UPI0039847ABF
MKKNLVIASLGALLTLTACNKKQDETANPEELKSYTVKGNPDLAPADTATAAAANDTTAPADGPKEGDKVTVRGKVTEITQGKDGYTAKLKVAEGQFFNATVSIPNMKDPKQYKAVKTDEMITVTGTYFKLGKEDGVKVTAFE